MTNKNLKSIVRQIQKTAITSLNDSAAPAPVRTGPGNLGNAPITTTDGVGTRYPSSALPMSPVVKQLQEAILKFADVASATDVTSMQGNKEGKQEGEQSRQIPVSNDNKTPGYSSFEEGVGLNQSTKNDKNYLGSSDAFGNFLVQQYLNTDVAGQPNRQSASMNPTNLRGIIDTIKRVGSLNAKGEKSVDGLWQTRTNNALHVIADLVSVMLSFTNDMGLKVQGNIQNNLNYFKSLVPKSYNDMKSTQEVNERAEKLIPHINAMTKFFENINSQVFNNKDLRKYIDQKTPFAQYPKSIQVPDSMKAMAIPGVKFDWIQNPAQNWISLHELSSLDNFKRFMQRLQYPETPEMIKKILDLVSEKLNQSEIFKSRT